MQQKNSVDQKHQEKTEKTINCSRRKALKTIAAGTAAAGTMALAGKWSKPVVDTIILPAHAQATNPTGPATTTPEPTTTSGECSPRLASASYLVTRDLQTGFAIAVTVSGTVTPAIAGAAIVIDFNVLHADNSTSSNTLNATTDAAGAYSATQSFVTGDQVTEVGNPGVVGPCGDTMDAQPGGMGPG
jgi:hypothetical protein